MSIYVLNYRYIDDPETVQRHRPKHREYLTTLQDELLACGPLGEPGPAGGLLIFNVESLARMQQITDEDPFRTLGAVDTYTIQSWSLFIGEERFMTG